MYVSVPKNYSGIAFSRSESSKHSQQQPMDMPEPPCEKPLPPPQKEEPCENPKENSCEGCKANEKNPLSCLLNALKSRDKSGFDTEDFLLIGLIALLVGKEGNEDILLILAMLLLI